MNIKTIILEEIGNLYKKEFGNNVIFTINDFKELFLRLGYDDLVSDFAVKMATRIFRHSGDEGIVEWIKKQTGLDIYPISKGHYTLSPPV